MKTILKGIAILVMLNTVVMSKAQMVEDPYEVGTWKGFTEAAISYTFDDNCSNQYAVAIPMLNEFGFKATFFPVINWNPIWADFQSAADAGHEIGSHTVSHPHLVDLSDTLQNEQLKDSQDEINANITGQSCLTLAYPYCDPSDDSITAKYYIAARHCQGYTEKSTPDDFFNISSIICGNEGTVETTEDFKNIANDAAASNGWNVYLLHGIDKDGGYSPVTSAVLRQSLEYLDYNRDKFWVSTFGNVVRYIRERNAVSVEELDLGADTIKVQVTDTLDDAIYNFPVTIRRPIPETWSYAVAFQNGEPVETTVTLVDTTTYIAFDAIPDAGVVTICSAEMPPYTPSVDKPFEIGTWKNFAEAAITYTFDDNCSNQYSVAIPMFNDMGFDATFYPVIDWSPNWTTFQNAADSGHEIGSHTISHPRLNELSDSLQNVELKVSQEDIDANINGQSCLTIAYPECVPSVDTITSKYYIAARNCQGNIETTTPADFLNISSIICGSEGSIQTTDDFNNNADSAAKLNGWSVYLLHGIDNDGGYSPVSSDELQGSLDYLYENKDTFWVSTFINVVRYIRERNAASLEVNDLFSDSIYVEVTDTLDDAIYNFPLTIRRKLPDAWPYAEVSQNGTTVETEIKDIDDEKYIYFDATPDNGMIIIKSAEAPEEPEEPENVRENVIKNTLIKIDPNPFSSEINIRADGNFGYSIYDLNGRLLEKGNGFASEKVGGSLIPGIYIINIRTATDTIYSKIIKR